VRAFGDQSSKEISFNSTSANLLIKLQELKKARTLQPRFSGFRLQGWAYFTYVKALVTGSIRDHGIKPWL
jgi:hypothetical protein